jgi:hypothetical protein
VRSFERTDVLPDKFFLVLPFLLPLSRFAAKTQALHHVVFLFFTAFAAVSAEDSGQREFSQFMPDHFFGNEHFVEHLPIVNKERVPHELRHDGTSPRPSFDRLFLASGFQFYDLSEQ